MMKARVDNIPFGVKLYFLPYAYVVGFLHFLFVMFLRATCRVEIHGGENREKAPQHICCFWHYQAWLGFICRNRNDYTHLLNHPARYMYPIHVMLYLFGAKKLVFVSPGQEGRRGVDEIVEYLKSGGSTFINPDGPSGPPKKIKKGVYWMAKISGVPILPVKVVPDSYWVFPSWDGKQIPFPFTRIKYIYGPPVVVGEKSFEEIEKALESAL